LTRTPTFFEVRLLLLLPFNNALELHSVDEVHLLKKELEEWKRKAQDSETKYEVSQKKLMQVWSFLSAPL